MWYVTYGKERKKERKKVSEAKKLDGRWGESARYILKHEEKCKQ